MFGQGQLAMHGLAILLGRNEAGISNRGKKFLHHAVLGTRKWLRKCCGQIEAEVVSNIRDKFHQTTSKPFAGARYTRSKSDMMSHDVLVTDSFGTDTDARAAR